MKKIPIYLIILILFGLFNYLFLTYLKKDILRKNDLANFSILNKSGHLENAFLVHCKLETYRIDNDLILIDSLGQITKMDSLMPMKKKLCFKFSKYACNDCVLASINYLKKFNYLFLKSNVLIITDSFDKEELDFERKQLNLPCNFFYHKKPMFRENILDNSTVFFIIDGYKLENAFAVNPSTVKYLNIYFKSLFDQFNIKP